MASPWWYRGRTWVFGAVYFGGFLTGGLSAALFHRRYVPAFREIGARLGPDGALWPSLVPRMVPVARDGDVTPSLVQGLLAEVFTAALLLGILLTLADPHHGYLYFFVLYIAGIVAQRMIARRQQLA